MKINKIKLENFRSFKGTHEIEFAPINLFFGANSVGKSSIFKALKHFNQLKKDDVFIGESSASVLIIFSSNIIEESWEEYSDSQDIEILEAIEEKQWALDFFRNFQLNANSFFVKKGIELKEVEGNTFQVNHTQYGLNDIWFFEYYEGVDTYDYTWDFNKVRINLSHPIFESHPFLKLKSSKKSFEILNECFERFDGQDKGYAPYLLTEIIKSKKFDSLGRSEDLNLLMDMAHESLKVKSFGSYKTIKKSIPVLFWVVRAVYKAMPDLGELVHLGPLRTVPQMMFDELNPDIFDPRFLDGGKGRKSKQERIDSYTGDAAWKSILNSDNLHASQENIARYSGCENKKLIPLDKRVNTWLLGWFNAPYEIQFHRKFVFTAYQAEKLQKISTDKLKIEDLSSESARVVFKNVQNGSVSPANEIGVGISQLTPVIVNALETKSFSVEQPELHIHPRMQTVLGDLFVFEGLFSAVEGTGDVTVTTRDIEGQSVERHFNRKKVKDESFILVETHSEHLILRLLKRIREGILKPDDLAIYYFENDKGKTKSSRIQVDSDGEFTTPWPDGFFDERLEELF